MEQKQRLDYLVEKFKEDSGEYSDLAVPDSEPEKRRILRSFNEYPHAPVIWMLRCRKYRMHFFRKMPGKKES